MLNYFKRLRILPMTIFTNREGLSCGYMGCLLCRLAFCFFWLMLKSLAHKLHWPLWTSPHIYAGSDVFQTWHRDLCKSRDLHFLKDFKIKIFKETYFFCAQAEVISGKGHVQSVLIKICIKLIALSHRHIPSLSMSLFNTPYFPDYTDSTMKIINQLCGK